jgi:hypothetical protein
VRRAHAVHLTDKMKERYSTVDGEEQREGIGLVLSRVKAEGLEIVKSRMAEEPGLEDQQASDQARPPKLPKSNIQPLARPFPAWKASSNRVAGDPREFCGRDGDHHAGFGRASRPEQPSKKARRVIGLGQRVSNT